MQTGRMARAPDSKLPHLDTVSRVLHLYRQKALDTMGLPEPSLPQLQPELSLLGSGLHLDAFLESPGLSPAGLKLPWVGGVLAACSDVQG